MTKRPSGRFSPGEDAAILRKSLCTNFSVELILRAEKLIEALSRFVCALIEVLCRVGNFPKSFFRCGEFRHTALESVS